MEPKDKPEFSPTLEALTSAEEQFIRAACEPTPDMEKLGKLILALKDAFINATPEEKEMAFLSTVTVLGYQNRYAAELEAQIQVTDAILDSLGTMVKQPPDPIPSNGEKLN